MVVGLLAVHLLAALFEGAGLRSLAWCVRHGAGQAGGVSWQATGQ